MNPEDLAEALADLTRRVEVLEGGAPRPTSPAAHLEVVGKMLDGLPPHADVCAGTVMYAGAGQTQGGPVAFQLTRDWDELVEAAPGPVASSFAALASPTRVVIVQLLLSGPATKAELSAALAEPTAGQLYHHLKELLSAGLVHQPRRAVYAIPPQKTVPLLALLSAGLDAAATSAMGRTEDDHGSREA